VTEYLIKLPWPDSGLSQNARGHWSKKARKVSAARHEAWALANQQKVTCIPDAVLEFSFSPPTDKRKARDLQNMPEMMKAAIDGIADAMGCDDKLFTPVWPTKFEDPIPGGCVLVHIKPVK
jgi:crossover junction endodeoxyribonuclease RusA